MKISIYFCICLFNLNFFQATELCSYFKALGATNVDDDQNSDLSNIVAVADLCFKVSDKYILISNVILCLHFFLSQEGNEADAEGILNSIVSMLVLLPNEKAEPIITTFCKKLVKPPSNKLGLVCLRVLVF